MAEFISHYSLCTIPEPNDLLGVAADRDKENIILTLGKNISLIIKPSIQKPLQSWSVVEKLSSKIVYDPKSEKYVGVFGNYALRCWNGSDIDVNKCKKLEFKKKIVELASTGQNTIVIYSDGTCETLANAIKSSKKTMDTSVQQLEPTLNHNFSDSSVVTLSDGGQVLIYFKQHNDGKLLEVVQHNLEDSTSTCFNLSREGLDERIVGYTLVEGDGTPMLLSIWSDKRIFLLNLDEAKPKGSPGKFVAMIPIIKVDKPLSAFGLSQHCVAIYGANDSQEGSTLFLYNTQFKLIKAKQFFKVYFEFSRLWGVNEHILLAMGQNLSVISYRIQKESLSDLVGMQTNNDFQTQVHGDNINEEDSLQECIQYTNGTNSTKASKNFDEIIYSAIEADGKLVPFEAAYNFDKTLDVINELQISVEMTEVRNSFENGCVILMPKGNDGSFVNKEVRLIASELESCGVSEHEISEKLLLLLIEMKLLEDIAICLHRYSNISEKMLAKTLSYILCKFEEYSIELQSKLSEVNGEKNANELVNQDFNNVLIILLKCSFDPSNLAIHIRQEIDFPKVLILFDHLYEMLTSSGSQSGVESESVEYEMHLIRWVNVLLDSHYQMLLLSKDVRLLEILFKWHKLFLLYKCEVFKLEQIATLLYNTMQHKKIYKEKNYSRWYSIEEVTLN